MKSPTVRHRDPVVAMGRGFAVMLALSSLAGIGDGVLQNWLGGVGMLPILSFSRRQEEQADSTALQAVLNLYGHVDDAAAFFEAVARRQSLPESPTMFNTHPEVEQRIARIRDFSARHVNSNQAPATPMPAFMKAA